MPADLPTEDPPTPLSEPAFFILLCLASRPQHGYALLQEAEQLSGGRLKLSVSTLYTALNRLQGQGLIERVESDDPDPRPGLPRKVYRLTRQGLGALDVEALRLRGMVAAYQRQLGAGNV
jgi:DNA-binding PadR family transcriptional regulator